jgi:hypothetical protein
MEAGLPGSAAVVGGVNVDRWRGEAGVGEGPPAMGMTFSRRWLLTAGGAATLAAMLGELPRAIAALGEMASPAYLRRSSYLPLIGDPFELTAPGQRRVVARLISVTDVGIGKRMRALAGAEDAFALLFHSSSRAGLEQDVMSLGHPALGRFQLLVSPASTGRRGEDYSATVNRARSPRL